jgi:large subunit ribosomal protein L15
MASKEDKPTPEAAEAAEGARAGQASDAPTAPDAPAAPKAEKEPKAAKEPKAEKEPKAAKAAKPAKAVKAGAAEKAEKAAEAEAETAERAAKAESEPTPGAEAAAEPEPEADPEPEPEPEAGAEAGAEGGATASSNWWGGDDEVLKVHHLRPAPGSRKAKTRVGRGEGSKGKTAGRGTKGSKARGQVPARLEGGQMPLHMRLPKLRGFKNPFRVVYQVVNLDKLEALYPDGGEVTSEALAERGAVRRGRPVKVLGGGSLTVPLTVRVEAASDAAREKILAAGGSVEPLE